MALSKYDGFLDCRMQLDSYGKGRGFAHADFDTIEHANHLVNKNDIIIDDRHIKIELSNSKP